MEVQANSNYRLFMDEVLPYAAQLRQRYARCNCTSALSILLRCAALCVSRAVSACAVSCSADGARVLLGFLCFLRRDPFAQAVSMYRHTALRRTHNAPRDAPPPSLPEWLVKTHDPQTRAMLGYNVRNAEIGGVPFHTCFPAAQARALLNLRAFDVIGVTERLDAFLAALAERTGWRAALEDGDAALAAARNAQSYEGEGARWRRGALTAAEVAALAEHTACDTALHAAAAATAGVTAPAAIAAPAALPTLPSHEADDADAVTEARRAAALTALRAQHRIAAAAGNNAPASGGALPRCALVVFYHVAKTGGAYVRFLMQASRAAGDWQARALAQVSLLSPALR